MNYPKLLFAIVPVLLFLTGCDNTGIFNQTVEINEATWPFEKEIHFESQIEDTVNLHDVVINLRTGKTYEYSNLWLFVDFRYPNGKTYTDTIECPLAYPDGRWVGSTGPGYVNTAIIIKKDMVFPAAGDYKINVRHGMRDDTLSEIKNIGLRIQRAV